MRRSAQVGSTAVIEGVAALTIPWLHQSVAALLDSRGQVLVYLTPKPPLAIPSSTGQGTLWGCSRLVIALEGGQTGFQVHSVKLGSQQLDQKPLLAVPNQSGLGMLLGWSEAQTSQP